MFGEFGFVSGHPAVVGLSSTPECVFFFSSITNLGPLVVLFLVPVLCSSVCVWLSQLSAWLGWSGSLRFSCAWVLIEPVWFWSYGRNTGGTGWTGSVLGWGVFTGLFEETCLQVLFKCWSSHLHNVMEIVVVYILLVELQSGQILLLWSMQSLEIANTWALLEHRCGIPIQEVITLVSFERICTTTMSHGSWFLGSSGLGRLCRLGVSDWNPPGKADWLFWALLVFLFYE